jgi:hypothetical protein
MSVYKHRKILHCEKTLVVFDYKVPVGTVVPLLWILKLHDVNDVTSGFSVQEPRCINAGCQGLKSY